MSKIDKTDKTDKNIINLINKDFSYPDTHDSDLQRKLYEKRELYYYKMPEEDTIKDPEEIKKYRTRKCKGKLVLQEHQNLLSNFINPDTPYRGVLVFHGVGTGKTCAAIAIAEKFKQQVQRFGTKIYILVPGPLLKEQWKRELINCTGDTYLNSANISEFDIDSSKQEKDALQIAFQYYKFISYKGFHKRVLGEKIVLNRNGKKQVERDIPTNRLDNLNNTLIIVDESHNLTGNEYGDALQTIIDNSINLKVVLLTATPMKNLADDIVDLVNFLRPKTHRIERDHVFTSDKNHEMKFKPGGQEYLKQMTSGYVSYLKGGNPLTYANKLDMGKVPLDLKFTKVISCDMLSLQRQTYDKTIKEFDDALDRKSGAVSNFTFPGLDENKNLVGFYSIEGQYKVINQLKLQSDQINNKICELLKIKNNNNMIYLKNDEKSITGNYLKKEYLKYFSTKFYECLINIEGLTVQDRGARTCFIYSNLVRCGIELFKEVLLINGYFEFDEHGNYSLTDESICYYCGHTYKKHESEIKNVATHVFYPATFVVVTGKSDEGSENVIPEEKQRILDEVFSNIENKNGKRIKFVLGSKVMNEGISLKNVAEVHILDVYYNLGRIEQVVGRAIRWCSHYALMIEGDTYPDVKVYKYCITLGGKELSSEELLYKKAELKYLLIKEVEQSLKEVAIDCPLNLASNVSKDLVKKHKGCEDRGDCPEVCDFTNCGYKCYDKTLNKYYDPDRMIYKRLDKDSLDYSTFIGSLAKGEIDTIKSIIKKLYRIKHIYTLKDIIKYVKFNYDKTKIDLYDDLFVFKALDELIPITPNDINNFKDYIKDKYGTIGYIIAIKENYIFQPVDQPKNLSIYYRTIFSKNISSKISLSNYIAQHVKIEDYVEEDKIEETVKDTVYDLQYYDSRPEFDYVGIVANYKEQEQFKLRDKRGKVNKKRAIGLPSLTGAVCTTRDKNYVNTIAKKLKIPISRSDRRANLCQMIKDTLLYKEKYSVGKEKMTYVMIPKDHQLYPFPYNIEDRVKYIDDTIKLINNKINVVAQNKNKNIIIQINKVPSENINELKMKLKKFGLTNTNENNFIITIT